MYEKIAVRLGHNLIKFHLHSETVASIRLKPASLISVLFSIITLKGAGDCPTCLNSLPRNKQEILALEAALELGVSQSTQDKLPVWDVIFLVSRLHRRVSKHSPSQSLHKGSGKQCRLNWPNSSVYPTGPKFTQETTQHYCNRLARTVYRYTRLSYSSASTVVHSSMDASNTERYLTMHAKRTNVHEHT